VVATLSIKNLALGAPLRSGPKESARWSDKRRYHVGARQMHYNIMLTAQRLRPFWGVTVIEGMEGNGPNSGIPVPSRLAIASTDYVAAAGGASSAWASTPSGWAISATASGWASAATTSPPLTFAARGSPADHFTFGFRPTSVTSTVPAANCVAPAYPAPGSNEHFVGLPESSQRWVGMARIRFP